MPSRDETTERDVDPMRLARVEGHWYLEGWCHRAQDVRLFRVDRIEDLEVLDVPARLPEGKAAAEVLKAGENPGPGLKILGLSAVIGAFVKLAAESGMRLIPDAWATSAYVGSSKVTAFIGTNLSPALLGVGYIVGLNIGIVVLSGAILSWHIAIPLYHGLFLGSDPQSPEPGKDGRSRF